MEEGYFNGKTILGTKGSFPVTSVMVKECMWTLGDNAPTLANGTTALSMAEELYITPKLLKILMTVNGFM